MRRMMKIVMVIVLLSRFPIYRYTPTFFPTNNEMRKKKNSGTQTNNRVSPDNTSIQTRTIKRKISPKGNRAPGMMFTPIFQTKNVKNMLRKMAHSKAETFWHCVVWLEQSEKTRLGTIQSRNPEQLVPMFGVGEAPVTTFPVIHAHRPILHPPQSDVAGLL